MKNVIITKEEIFDDFVKVEQFNNAATDVLALEGFQVDFDVTATNYEGETKGFHIVYQSEDRNNGLMAYNGYEMSQAHRFGCDADESQEMEEFLDYAEGIFDEMDLRADTLAKAKLDQLS